MMVYIVMQNEHHEDNGTVVDVYRRSRDATLAVCLWEDKHTWNGKDQCECHSERRWVDGPYKVKGAGVPPPVPQ